MLSIWSGTPQLYFMKITSLNPRFAALSSISNPYAVQLYLQYLHDNLDLNGLLSNSLINFFISEFRFIRRWRRYLFPPIKLSAISLSAIFKAPGFYIRC